MTEDQIKHMVNRFLGWKLPKTFRPDDGISYTPTQHGAATGTMPSGTNLFDATEADAMVRYLVDGLPASKPTEHPVVAAARAEAERFYPANCCDERAAYIDGARFAINHSQ